MKFDLLNDFINLREDISDDVNVSYRKKSGVDVGATDDKGFEHVLLQIKGAKSRVPNQCMKAIMESKKAKKDAESAIKENTDKLKGYATQLLDETDRGHKILVDTSKVVATIAKESETSRTDWNAFYDEICEQFNDYTEVFEAIKKKATTSAPKARSVNVKTINIKEGFVSNIKKFISFISNKFTKLENNLDNIKRKYGIA